MSLNSFRHRSCFSLASFRLSLRAWIWFIFPCPSLSKASSCSLHWSKSAWFFSNCLSILAISSLLVSRSAFLSLSLASASLISVLAPIISLDRASFSSLIFATWPPSLAFSKPSRSNSDLHWFIWPSIDSISWPNSSISLFLDKILPLVLRLPPVIDPPGLSMSPSNVTSLNLWPVSFA